MGTNLLKMSEEQFWFRTDPRKLFALWNQYKKFNATTTAPQETGYIDQVL